jgi:hypothetical protein
LWIWALISSPPFADIFADQISFLVHIYWVFYTKQLFKAIFIADIFADSVADGGRCLAWPAKRISRK